VHNVSRWMNVRHLGEPLGGVEDLLEVVFFKKVMESTSGRRQTQVLHSFWITAQLLVVFSRPYLQSRYWYSVASVVVVCDAMYCLCTWTLRTHVTLYGQSW